MKILLIVISTSVLLFTGCSSTYTIKYFSSKDNFYNDFNKFAGNKSLKVTLINDSSFISEEGVKISNDSLILPFMTPEVNKSVPFNEIKNIDYLSSNFTSPSAEIYLKNGNKFYGRNIKITDDSIVNFIDYSRNSIYYSLPLIRIKKICYKERWKNLSAGLLGGAGVGLITGLVIVSSYPNNKDHPDSYLTYIFSPVIGAVLGSAIGWIVGYTYTYQFNP
jgi:hypothetical protein